MKRGKVEFWKLHSCLEDQICIAQEWRYLFDDLNNHIEFGQPLPSNIKNRISIKIALGSLLVKKIITSTYKFLY